MKEIYGILRYSSCTNFSTPQVLSSGLTTLITLHQRESKIKTP